MRWKRGFCVGLAMWLAGTSAAPAQAPLPGGEPGMQAPGVSVLPPTVSGGEGGPGTAPLGMEPGSRPAERAEARGEPEEPKLGPTPVYDVRLLMEGLGLKDVLGESRIRVYGWLDQGYTYASTGPGLLNVETRENRFGNEYLLDQVAIVIERPLEQKQELNFGFNVTYYAGADASLLQPKGGIDDPPGNPRFSHDFRDLYLSAHLPVLTENGMDVKAGRQTTIFGYTGALAPYRTFYSNDYQWFYSQDGAYTGIVTNLHVTKQLDVLNGITLGANTFFTKRSENSYCYIGQVNYWLQEDKRTLLSASVYAGENAIFAAPGLAGDFDTVVELRVQHTWNKYFTQVLQSDMGWDRHVPGVGTGSWYGLYTICIFHLNKVLDFDVRGEWFDDVQGTRTGIRNNYEEATLGLNYHPFKYVELRPEVRGDFANNRPAFGNPDRGHLDRSQLTAAIEMLLKF